MMLLANYFLFASVPILCQLTGHICLAESNLNNFRYLADETMIGNGSDNFNTSADPTEQQDWYIVLSCSLLFAFLISLFGAFVGYFSFLEDALFKKYQREGQMIEGSVTSVEFVRVGATGCYAQQQNDAEYVVFVEYTTKIYDGYIVRIRKQMKAKASDFCNMRATSFTDIKSLISEGEDGIDAKPVEFHSMQGSTLDKKCLELLVFPEFERSGYPKKQIERACSMRYRLSTVVLLIFDILLVIFCIFIAARIVTSVQNAEQRTVGWYAIGAILVLIIVELPLIHFYCYEMMCKALADEYIDQGDYLSVPGLNDSLSSESDFHQSLNQLKSQRTNSVLSLVSLDALL